MFSFYDVIRFATQAAELLYDEEEVRPPVRRRLPNPPKIQPKRKCYTININHDEVVNEKELKLFDREKLVAKILPSEHGLELYGYDDDIHLKYTNTRNINVLYVNNSKAKIKLSLNCQSETVVQVIMRAPEVILDGEIKADLIRIHSLQTNAKLLIEKNTNIVAKNKLQIYSDEINCQGILLAEKISVSGKRLYVDKNSEWNCKRNTIKLNQVKFFGKLRANTLTWKILDGIYLAHAASIIVAKHYDIKARKMMITHHTLLHSEETGKLAIENKLVIDKNSQLTARSVVSLEADQVDNYSRIYVAVLNAHVKDVFINHKLARIRTIARLNIEGGSLWNAGEIEFGERFDFSLNKVFVHGIAYSDEFFGLPRTMSEVFARPNIIGKDINGVASAMIQIFSTAEARNVGQTSLVFLNLFTLLERVNSRKSNLLSLDLGLDLPNIPALLNDIKQFFDKISRGDFVAAIQEDILTISNVIKFFSAVRWFLAECIPVLKKPINVTWGILMFIVNLEPFIKNCIYLANLERSIEFRDVIPLLQFFSSAASQAYITTGQIESLVQTGVATPEFHAPDLNNPAPILIEAASLLSPVSTEDSLVNISSGVQLTGVSVKRSAVSVEAGELNLAASQTNLSLLAENIGNMNVAVDILDEGQSVKYDHTLNVAAHLTVQANDVNMASTMTNGHSVSYYTNDFHVDNYSNLNARTTAIEATNHAELNGVIQADQLSLNIPNFTDTNELLQQQGAYAQVQAQESLEINTNQKVVLEQYQQNVDVKLTSPDIQIKENLHVQGNITLNVTQGNLNINHDIKSDKNVNLSARETVDNKSFIQANEIFIQATDIKNNATIHADNYLELYAQHDVINYCTESWVHGAYDWMKAWRVAHLYGGSGMGHQGVGINIYAGHQFINDASVVESQGDLQINAQYGISSTARSHTYVSYHSVSRKWYGKKSEKTITSVQVANAYFTAHLGAIRLLSESGKIYSVSTQFTSHQGNIIYGAEGVTLKGMIANQHYQKSSSSWWGLEHSQTNRYDQVSVPTRIETVANTTIASAAGDVLIENASIHSDHLQLSGKNIHITTPILHHSLIEDEAGFNFNVPLFSQFENMIHGNFSSLFPLYQDYRARVGNEKLTIDAFAEMNRLISLSRLGTFTPCSILAIQPVGATIGYRVTHTEMNYQTVADNYILANSIDMHAQQISINNGIPIIANDTINIEAETLIQSGAKLSQTVESSTQDVSVSVGLSGVTDVGIDTSKTQMSSTTYVNQVLKAKSVHIHTNRWEQYHADVEADSVVAEVNEKVIVNEEETYELHSSHVGLHTNGQVNIGTINAGDDKQIHNHDYSFNVNVIKECADNFRWLQQQFSQAALNQTVAQSVVKEWDADDEMASDDPSTSYRHSNRHHAVVHHLSSSSQRTAAYHRANQSPSISLCEDEYVFSSELENSISNFIGKTFSVFSHSGFGKIVDKSLAKTACVFNFYDSFQNALAEGKSQDEALWISTRDLISYLVPREALEATLTAFEMECLGLPFAGIEATCVIAAENKDAFNRQIDTVEQSFNQVKLNENNSSFWTRATMVWLKTNLEDKRMQYNLLAKVGSKL